MEITHQDKIKILKREIAIRKKVYKAKIYFGEMKPETAAFEIAGMEAILADYEGKQIGLFNNG
jgi:hypothetical protein